MRRLLVALVCLLTGCSGSAGPVSSPTPAATSPSPSSSVFRVGQVWGYQTRAGEEKSTLTIVKVETVPDLGEVVHISIQGLKIKNPDGKIGDKIAHMPMTPGGLRKSNLKLLKEHAPLPDFQDGYRQWQNAQGGAFDLTVAEAVAGTERVVNQSVGTPLP